MTRQSAIEKRFVLGTASLVGQSGGYGLSNTSKEDGIRILSMALDRGVRWFDTAPVYGFGEAEALLSEFSRDSRMKILSKCGIHWNSDRRIFHDNSPYLLWKDLEATLMRIKRSVVDVYMVHWPDPKVESRKCLDALMEMKEKGLISELGLSNFGPEEVLQLSKDFPIGVIQNDFIGALSSDYNAKLLALTAGGIRSQCYGIFGKGAYICDFNKNTYQPNDFRRSKHCNAKSLKENAGFLRGALGRDASAIQPGEVISYALTQTSFDQIIIGQSSLSQLHKNLDCF